MNESMKNLNVNEQESNREYNKETYNNIEEQERNKGKKSTKAINKSNKWHESTKGMKTYINESVWMKGSMNLLQCLK